MQQNISTNRSSQNTSQNSDNTSILKPRINLYETDEGWLMIAALPQAVKAETQLETEGHSITLKAPHENGGYYQRVIEFPSQTVWGQVHAEWRDDLLRVNISRPQPKRHHIEIN